MIKIKSKEFIPYIEINFFTDVPEWIRLYSQAPFESDHLLNVKKNF